MFVQLNINDFDRDFQDRVEEYCYMYQENILTKKIRGKDKNSYKATGLSKKVINTLM